MHYTAVLPWRVGRRARALTLTLAPILTLALTLALPLPLPPGPSANPTPSPNPNPSQVGRPIQWGAFSSTAWDASTAKLFTDRDSGVILKLT